MPMPAKRQDAPVRWQKPGLYREQQALLAFAKEIAARESRGAKPKRLSYEAPQLLIGLGYTRWSSTP